MANTYLVTTGAMATTAASTDLATGTAIKTLLQIATSASRGLKVIEWGVSFNGVTATAVPVKCELIDTGAVAATVTAHVAAGVQPYENPSAPASLVTLGTSATGYNASAEGTVTTSRYGDLQFVSPNGGQWVHPFPLGREWSVAASRILRVRVTAAATVQAYAYVIYEE